MAVFIVLEIAIGRALFPFKKWSFKADLETVMGNEKYS